MSSANEAKKRLLEEVKHFEKLLPQVICSWDARQTQRFKSVYADYRKHKDGSIILLTNAVRNLRPLFKTIEIREEK